MIVKLEDLSSKKGFTHKRYLILLKWIMQGAKLNHLNQLYKEQYSSNPDEFIENILEVLEIRPEYLEKELESIPETGHFMAYANHPMGILDGLLFIYLLRKKRKDIKILANDLLSRIEPFKDLLIPVDLYAGKSASKKNVAGLKLMYNHLENNGGVLIFPAGEVSTIYDGRVQDKAWKKSVVKLMVKAQVPLIPVFFDGKNSMVFHLKGKIHSTWRTLSLASEMYNKQNTTIGVRIGSKITEEQLSQYVDLEEQSNYLRARIYGLSNPKKESVTDQILDKIKLKPSKVVKQMPTKYLKKEVKALSEDKHILEIGNLALYLVKESDCPNIVQEIGRLREITFRAVGEGTGKSLDLDIFDSYYHHLFVWDKHEHCVVGSYRVGFGADIIEEFGKSGFYSNKLFKFKKDFKPTLERSIELGRSFIRQEYQKHPLTLLLLWQGILELLIKNDHYRYLLGPVSISNDFSTISKEIMILYLKSQFYDHERAKYIKARKPFKIKYKDISKTLLNAHQDSLRDIESLIEELEPFGLKIPVLLKKYLGQNAKIVGFNIDPNFNNCLDGLILLDFAMIPSNTIKKFSKADPYPIFQRQNAFYYENAIQL